MGAGFFFAHSEVMISPGKLSFVHWGSFVSGKTSVRNFALRFLIVVGAAVCCFVVNEANREAVARLPKIEVVGAGCRGTDEGVRALTGHPALSNFSLNGANYTDASADVIPKLPALGELSFKRTSHTDAGLAKAITSCRAFSIAFETVAVGEQTIAALANVPNLNTLYFKDVDLTLEQCDALAKLRLSYLQIDSKNFSDDHLARLSPLAKSLHQLSLTTPQVTDAGLAWLKQANALTYLHLNDTQATAAMWSSLPSIATLGTVGMGGTNFNAETAACTSRMTSLFGIFLTGSEIDDETLELLPAGIKFFRLDDTSVTPDGLKKLAQRKGITGVHVTRRSEAPLPITAADVKAAQAVAGPGVRITYYEFPLDGCD